MTEVAIRHIVIAPATSKPKGVLVRSLFHYSELRRLKSGVDITVGSLRKPGLSHCIVLMCKDRSMRVLRWKE